MSKGTLTTLGPLGRLPSRYLSIHSEEQQYISSSKFPTQLKIKGKKQDLYCMLLSLVFGNAAPSYRRDEGNETKRQENTNQRRTMHT